jgi:hypothetical protein
MLLNTCLTHSSTLKMVAECSSKMMGNSCQTALCHVLEDST